MKTQETIQDLTDELIYYKQENERLQAKINDMEFDADIAQEIIKELQNKLNNSL